MARPECMGRAPTLDHDRNDRMAARAAAASAGPPPAPPTRRPPPPPPQPAVEGAAPVPVRGVELPCRACGAALAFAPGTLTLVCHHCGGQNMIGPPEGRVVEHDYEAALRQLEAEVEHTCVGVVSCTSCGATTEHSREVAAGHCPYCGTHFNVTHATAHVIRPTAVLPFAIPRDDAERRFRAWLAARWFAPSALHKEAKKESHLEGVYLPHWLYDAHAATAYRGWHGRHYWVTVGSGKNQRRVRRTSWSPVTGRVRRDFRELLVIASTSGLAELAARLGAWDLKAMVPYDDRYVAGFLAERHTVDLRDGFARARAMMAAQIDLDIRRDIGGDTQRVDERRTNYSDIRFRHTLLPMWVSSYRYRGSAYRFAINGRTGAVTGSRPYSFWKILAAVMFGLAAALVILAIATAR